MQSLEEEAKLFLENRRKHSNDMDEILKSLKSINKQLEIVLKKLVELNAKNNTHA